MGTKECGGVVLIESNDEKRPAYMTVTNGDFDAAHVNYSAVGAKRLRDDLNKLPLDEAIANEEARLTAIPDPKPTAK